MPEEKSLREKQKEARQKKMAELNPGPQRVRVTPANDALRKALMHPLTGMKFPESGSAEWPLDQFTKRRIREGSITVEGGEQAAKQQPREPQPQQQPKSRAEQK